MLMGLSAHIATFIDSDLPVPDELTEDDMLEEREGRYNAKQVVEAKPDFKIDEFTETVTDNITVIEFAPLVFK